MMMIARKKKMVHVLMLFCEKGGLMDCLLL
jgi:hypothetical protein